MSQGDKGGTPALRRDAWTAVFRHPLFQIQARLAEFPGGHHPVARMSTADWVNVVAITADEQLVLIRQYRHGIEAETLEIAGGLVDPGEEPSAAAARELREETGYGGGTWQSLGVVHPNPAIQDNRCWLYVARGVERLGDPEPDPTEQIEVELRPLDEAVELIESGRITHSLVVVSLLKVLLGRG